MDNESTYPRQRVSVTPESAQPPAAAPRAAASGPAAAVMPSEDSAGPAASRLRCLDEVVSRVKLELERGQERQRGANPYDSRLGRPNRDVWGTRRRA
jgi:hypothetical protein